MKKTFVTALVVGSCMLASETTSAQEAGQLLTFHPDSEEFTNENRRRDLGKAKAKEGSDQQDTGNDENADQQQEDTSE